MEEEENQKCQELKKIEEAKKKREVEEKDEAAEHNSLVKACDGCRKDKLSCPGRPGTVKVPRGKKRQCPTGEPSLRGKGKKRQRSPVLEVPEVSEVMEYDDQAWVAAANSIVAELARTNSLLERNILAAEGSRAAVDRMCTGLDLFLQQQREFQALLFGELRMGSRMTADEGRMALDDEWMSLDEGWKALDVEEDEKDGMDEKDGADEEMNKESGSEVDGSGEADESMEM
ncbi:hypothetical protein CY34DRAFT_771364 [Suillus luteus UH-Slu-Lm8-n1]|uniref:Uncharacterized protein n=1 Tax=Suillus luteus UH-Slu-Lm8-n1 TaxID=930992 RepID=A0A0C9ZMH5_9AGAM|nr:hypothetical protein CY34DRAFT_771364 [Suillus luteus UH-Slu-Lm8-n1]